MDYWIIICIFGLIILLLAMETWVGLALGAAGIVLMTFFAKMPGLIGVIMYNSAASYVLSAIPFFIFMGEIVMRGGISSSLYNGVSKWTSVTPGGLCHSNILSCAIFAAISGSSVATAATIGTVAYPEQTRRGYDKRIVTGSLTAGGTLGPMIPPSIGMILYGAFVGESVGKLFIGTAIPGIMMAIMFMIYIYIRFLLNPSLGPKQGSITRRYFWDGLLAWIDVWPTILLMAIIFGGIYGGVMTPTEAAAVSSFVAICLVLSFKRLSLNLLKEAAVATLQISSMIFLIIIAAKIMGGAMAMLMIPKQLIAMVSALNFPPLVVWLILIIVYLILGCFMDAIAILFLTLPVVYPLMMNLGYDSVWFGVILGITLETGLLTPPVGMNLYVIQGVTKVPFMDIVKGSFPFFVIMLIGITLITAFPQLATWLPSTMRYG